MSTVVDAFAIEPPPFARRRWTIAEFLGLIDGGYLPEGNGTFLWDGAIYEPMPESAAHRDPVEILRDLLPERFPRAGFTVNTGKAIHLEEYYRPQPDLTVLRGPRAAFAGRDPCDLYTLEHDVPLVVRIDGEGRDFGTIRVREVLAHALDGPPRDGP